MGIFLIFLGFLVNLVGGIMLLMSAFRKSIGWGLACLFLPFAGLVFIIQNWEETKKAFFTSLAGMAIVLVGVMASPSQPKTAAPQVAGSNAVQASSVPPSQSYEPPRSAYSPPPAYVPPQQPSQTTTFVEEEKRTLEMVYIDRDTRTYYTEKCKKKPENVARVAKTVALMQGYTPARCGS